MLKDYWDVLIEALIDPVDSTMQGVIDWENSNPYSAPVLGANYLGLMPDYLSIATMYGYRDRGKPMNTQSMIINRVMGYRPLAYVDMAEAIYAAYRRGYGE